LIGSRRLEKTALSTACAVVGLLGCMQSAWAGPTTAPAEQDDELVRLDWAAPEECPKASVLAAHIRRLAGTGNGRDSVHATAHVTHGLDGQWRVRLVLSGAVTGTRALQAADCTSLARATALIVALAANPQVASRITEAEQGPLTEEEPPEASPQPSEEPTGSGTAPSTPPKGSPAPVASSRGAAWPRLAHATPREEGLEWSGGVNLISHLGLLPSPALGGELSLGLARQSLSLALLAGGSPWAPSDTSKPYVLEREAHVGLRSCWAFDDSLVEASLCAVGKAHLLWATGKGLVESRTARSTLATYGLGPRIAWLIMPRWRAFAEADVMSPSRRPRAVAASGETLYEAAWVTAAISAGVVYRW